MAGYTEALKHANAQTVKLACAYAQANGEEWYNMPSNYFNRGADISYQNLTVCRMAALADPSNPYGTNASFCNNGFRNGAGQDVDKPAVCGGPGPNDLPAYNPLEEALAQNQEALENIASQYASMDRSKKILIIAIVIAVVMLILGGIWLI